MVDLIQKVPVLGAAEREGTGARSSAAAAHLSFFMTAVDPDETEGVPAERRVYF